MFRKKATHFFKFAQKIFPRFVLVSFCPITGMITLPKRGRFPPDHPSMPRGQCPPPNTARRSAAPHSNTAPTHRPSPDHPAQHKNVRHSIPLSGPPTPHFQQSTPHSTAPRPAPPADITPPATRLPALIPGAAAPHSGMIRSPRSSQSGTITPDLLLSRHALPRS